MPSNPPADPEIVTIAGLRLRFDTGGEVLGGIDLAVRRGEILALIGPSGCGKTSLLHLVMGLLSATAGQVEHHAEHAAMVFQKPQLLPWRSVLDNAAFGLECRGLSLPDARAEAEPVLRRMRLGNVLDAAPHQLSEGMKQRVNLARALAVRPDLLLMDEPFAALDVMTREQLWSELLQEQQARQMSVMLASHSLEEVVVLADRVAVLGGAPTTIATVEAVGLPRPRMLTGAGAQAVHERVVSMREHLPALDALP
jgi:ABC-type nitrate/sulfonate/bicarbonate transport system ATPase subunit